MGRDGHAASSPRVRLNVQDKHVSLFVSWSLYILFLVASKSRHCYFLCTFSLSLCGRSDLIRKKIPVFVCFPLNSINGAGYPRSIKTRFTSDCLVCTSNLVGWGQRAGADSPRPSRQRVQWLRPPEMGLAFTKFLVNLLVPMFDLPAFYLSTSCSGGRGADFLKAFTYIKTRFLGH